MQSSSRRTLVLGLGALAVAGRTGTALASHAGLASVRAYRKASQRAIAECSDALAASRKPILFGGSGGDYRDCIARKRAEVAQLYEAARASLRTRGARSAFSAYQQAFEAALAGIDPVRGESDAVHEQRQFSRMHALSHAWASFELAE